MNDRRFPEASSTNSRNGKSRSGSLGAIQVRAEPGVVLGVPGGQEVDEQRPPVDGRRRLGGGRGAPGAGAVPAGGARLLGEGGDEDGVLGGG